MTRSDLFTAIRPFAPSQRLTPDHVAVIDALADSFGIARVNNMADDWLPYALDLIKQFEGCRLTAYPDPATGGDPWTVGWGSTGAGIVRGVVLTQAQADARLSQDVVKFAAGVDKMLCGVPTTAYQKAAMVSLAYNIGLANLAASTLLKKHKAGDYAGADLEFLKWDKAAGKQMAGLTRRRAAEAKVYAS